MKVLVNVKSKLIDFLSSSLAFLLKQMSETQSTSFSSDISSFVFLFLLKIQNFVLCLIVAVTPLFSHNIKKIVIIDPF